MAWPTDYNPFGPNHVPLLVGLDAATGKIPTPVAVNSTTGAILLQITGNALVSAPLTGQAKIATTGTAIQLDSSSQPLTNGVIISAVSGNNAAGVTIGGATVTNTVNGTGNGYILAPGASVSFAIANTNELYINGTIGDIVSWAGS